LKIGKRRKKIDDNDKDKQKEELFLSMTVFQTFFKIKKNAFPPYRNQKIK
jgi:hypothetical protein